MKKKTLALNCAAAAQTKRKTAHNNHYSLKCSASCRACWSGRFVDPHCSRTFDIRRCRRHQRQHYHHCNLLYSSVELIAKFIELHFRILWKKIQRSHLKRWLHFNIDKYPNANSLLSCCKRHSNSRSQWHNQCDFECAVYTLTRKLILHNFSIYFYMGMRSHTRF